MLKIIVFSLIFLTLIVDNTYAYIDFGTGSYVLQILAASAIGFVFIIKNYLKKIKLFFTKKHPSQGEIINHSKDQE